MHERLRDPVAWLMAACAVLAVLVMAQLIDTLSASGPLDGVVAAEFGEPTAAAAGEGKIEVPDTLAPITEEKLFGEKPPRPKLPVQLVGIADDTAFIRSPRGRTGMLRVGESLDGVKLLRIGVNRAIVEENGKQKEITMHEGVGGSALLPAAPKPAATQPRSAATQPTPAATQPTPAATQPRPAAPKPASAPGQNQGGSR